MARRFGAYSLGATATGSGGKVFWMDMELKDRLPDCCNNDREIINIPKTAKNHSQLLRPLAKPTRHSSDSVAIPDFFLPPPGLPARRRSATSLAPPKVSPLSSVLSD